MPWNQEKILFIQFELFVMEFQGVFFAMLLLDNWFYPIKFNLSNDVKNVCDFIILRRGSEATLRKSFI